MAYDDLSCASLYLSQGVNCGDQRDVLGPRNQQDLYSTLLFYSQTSRTGELSVLVLETGEGRSGCLISSGAERIHFIFIQDRPIESKDEETCGAGERNYILRLKRSDRSNDMHFKCIANFLTISVYGPANSVKRSDIYLSAGRWVPVSQQEGLALVPPVSPGQSSLPSISK